MSNQLKSYCYPTSLYLFLLLAGSLFQSCSKWNVAPKEINANSFIRVYTYDLVTVSSGKWNVTFALGSDTEADPNNPITTIGVCYSTSNKEPSLADNYINSRTTKLPTSIVLTTTEKTTHYFRAYIILKSGATYYSRAGSFIPQ